MQEEMNKSSALESDNTHKHQKGQEDDDMEMSGKSNFLFFSLPYLSSKLTEHSKTYEHSTRNRDQLNLPKCRTAIAQSSFFYSSIMEQPYWSDKKLYIYSMF